MILVLEQRLRDAVREHLRSVYGFAPATLAVETPPRVELGEFALPVCFELAKTQRRAPRALAQEIAAALPLPAGFARIEAAGAGYLNAYVDRSQAAAAGPASGLAPRLDGKVIVEHTNINPNKAAHIGHLRNAVLGDTWVRLLRARGERVEVQNLQDNTGVQVADVVAGFEHLPPMSAEGAGNEARFDYLCWDVYAAISQHYAAHPEDRDAWRPATLHAIEAGESPLADDIANRMAECHLRTMWRLGIQYDVLPRESEILRMHLWAHAFGLLRDRKAIRLETEGKNQGCWVMDRAGASGPEGEEETKVIVRSNGTVTYVAKDIAYQMWKFGLLPLEFGYARFFTYPDGHVAWRTALASEAGAPAFGRGSWVFNVIDTRQSYLQEVVVAGLQALGAHQAAERSVHFSYEMVALTPACARELGYEVEAGAKRVDVSGRKGQGVKADDLMDRMLARTAQEVAARNPDMPAPEQAAAAQAIAVGALRYFLLKFTRTTVIAFDFQEALSFEGETGPYLQYAAVRAANILDKAGLPPPAGPAPGFLDDNEIWSLVWLASRLPGVVEESLQAQEPAILAKYGFQLAQAFNAFYHHHPVLQEADAARRASLLWVVARIRQQLAAALDLMGVPVPAAM